MDEETIGGRVKRLRVARGLSQRQLATPGVGFAHVCRIENGTRIPTLKALRALAEKLEVEVGYLETGEDVVDLRLPREIAASLLARFVTASTDYDFATDPVYSAFVEELRAHVSREDFEKSCMRPELELATSVR